MMTFEECYRALADVPNWTPPEEAAVLWRAAERACGPIVELGTFCGHGTALLAAAGTQPVMTIDPHPPRWIDRWQPEVRRAVTADRSIDVARPMWQRLGLADRIQAVELPCESAKALAQVPHQIGVLFVDAEHEDQSIREQLMLYGQRIASGGLIVFHDWRQERWRVRRVAREWMQAQPDYWRLADCAGHMYAWQREMRDGDARC